MAWHDKSEINSGNAFDADVEGQFTAENLNKIIDNVFELKSLVDNAGSGGESNPELHTLPTITENGQYTTGKYGFASPIEVNVEPNLTTLTVTENGTYNASDYGAEGFNTVDVSVISSDVATLISKMQEPLDRVTYSSNMSISAVNTQLIEIDAINLTVSTPSSVTLTADGTQRKIYYQRSNGSLSFNTGSGTIKCAMIVYSCINGEPLVAVSRLSDSVVEQPTFTWAIGADLSNRRIVAPTISSDFTNLNDIVQNGASPDACTIDIYTTYSTDTPYIRITTNYGDYGVWGVEVPPQQTSVISFEYGILSANNIVNTLSNAGTITGFVITMNYDGTNIDYSTVSTALLAWLNNYIVVI